MYRTANTLPEQIRSRSVALLNRHLAAAIDLHAQVKQAHWNVRGPTFIAIHELFDKVADAVEEYSDTIAERAGALGGAAEGTIQIAVERSFLPRHNRSVDAAEAHTALGANHDPAVAFAHGLTIMVFIAAFGDISGCHVIPR